MIRQKLKKIIAILCLGTAVLALVPAPSWAEAAAPVSYKHGNSVTPYLLYIADSQCDLSISNRVATVNCWLEGKIGSTKTQIIVELQEKNGTGWDNIVTWNDTQNSDYASVYKTKTVITGKTYRIKSTLTVWEGTQSETITVYSPQKTA